MISSPFVFASAFAAGRSQAFPALLQFPIPTPLGAAQYVFAIAGPASANEATRAGSASFNGCVMYILPCASPGRGGKFEHGRPSVPPPVATLRRVSELGPATVCATGAPLRDECAMWGRIDESLRLFRRADAGRAVAGLWICVVAAGSG